MITLTPEQENAKDSIVKFLLDSDPDNNRIVLQGMAGSGKSTIISQVYDTYHQQIKLLQLLDPAVVGLDWEFTATTNKAVDSLQKASGVTAVTIQSLLGLVVGSVGLQRTSRSLKIYDTIIVIDEASYVDYSLLHFIDEYLENSKIIYMGDPTQLPPVGFNHSPVFTRDCPTILLTKSMRQVGSPTLDSFCKNLRTYIETGKQFPKLSLTSEIIHLDSSAFNEAILKMNPDNSKILASKNNTVNRYNTSLFKAAKNRTHFMKGDKVINNSYAKGIATDEVITIIADPVRTKVLDIDGYNYTVRTHKGTFYVFMPDKVSYIRKKYKEAVEAKHWHIANQIQETWVDLRPHYACTIHKSQGSTYDEVYIDLNDFKSERDLQQLARLLYVAVSRAKHKVYLTGDIR